MNSPILEDPDFRTATAFAKGLAKQYGVQALSPLILLCGFVIANRNGLLGGALKELNEADKVVDAAASGAGLKLSSEIEPLDEGTIPTDSALRDIFESSGNNVIGFVDGLLNTIPEWAVGGYLREEFFSEIVKCASTLAQSKGIKEISPELLVAGAFVAYRNGLLHERPSISEHLRINASSIQALIDAHGWTIDKVSNYHVKLPLDLSVTKALTRSGNQPSNPLIAALNAGMVTALKLGLKKRVAYHEAGHAVISKLLRPEIGIAEVTIVDRGEADGCVSYEKTCPYFQAPPSRDGVLDQICVSLAGRVAEQKKYGHHEVDAGATSDLANATQMAWDAITRFGLDFEFGPVSLAALSKAGSMSSGWLFDHAQRRLQEILKAGLERTETLVREQWDKVEAVAQILFKQKRLTEDELLNVLGMPTATTNQFAAASEENSTKKWIASVA
jgi:hypothetical protein